MNNFLLLCLLITCTTLSYSQASQNKFLRSPDSHLLIGTWVGKYDTTKITLTFKKNFTGLANYSWSTKPFRFNYKFKNKSTLVIYDNSSSSMQKVLLTGNKLYLQAYPTSEYNKESVNLLNATFFYKSSGN